MDVTAYVNEVQNDPRFKELTFEEQVMMKEHLFNEIRHNDPIYRSAPLSDKREFEKFFMTDMPGFRPEDIQGDDLESEKTRVILSDVENVKAGGESALNAWNGMTETGRNYLTGKLGVGIIDLFTSGDTSEAIYGDQRGEAEKYRDYVYEKYDPEGLKDYKIGRIVGNIGGFASDALLASTLYGGVGTAGLLTKPLAGVSQKILQHSLAKFGTKAVGYIPLAIGQGSFEGIAYVGEQMLADKITGRLDSDQDIQNFVAGIPSTFLQGLAYFAVGETLGAGIGGALKSLGPVFTPKGGRVKTFGQIGAQSEEATMDAIKTIVGGGSEAEIKAKLKAMESYGIPEHTIKNLRESMENVRSMTDPNLFRDNPEELNKVTWKLLYGMDTEIVGDAIKVSSFDGKPITPQTFTSDAELHAFMRKMDTELSNELFENIAKVSSDRNSSIKVSVQTAGGSTSAPLNNDLVLKYFRPGSGMTNRKKLQAFARKTSGKDVELFQVEDYFNGSKRVINSDGRLVIPKYVTSGKEASAFADDFFKQLESVSDGTIKFDYTDMKTLLKDSGNIRYNKSFVKKLAGTGNYTFHKGGQVDIMKDGEVIGRYNSVREAGAALHMSEYSEAELAKSIKDRTGQLLQKEPDGSLIIKDNKGNETARFQTMNDLFMDASYRPDIPFNRRPTFMTVKMSGEAADVKTFDTGNVMQIKKALESYAKEDGAILTRFTSEKGRVSLNPKFNKYKVTLGDSQLTKEFESLKEAQDFLTKDMDSWKNIDELAREKGYRVAPTKSGYQVYAPNMEPQYGKSMKEVQDIISALDDIVNTKDLFDDITPDQFQVLKGEIGKAQDLANSVIKDMDKVYGERAERLTTKSGDFFRRMFVPIRERLEKIGNKEVVSLYDRLVGTDRAFRDEYAKIKQQTHGLFHGRDRKFSVQQLKDMGNIMSAEIDEAGWRALAEARGIELTDKMEDTMRAVRGVFDVLGTRFNIEPNKWVDNYLSRIANKDVSDIKKLMSQDVMSAAEGKGKVTLDDEFFRYARSEDYVAGIYETNVETLLDTYVRMGLRKQYMGDVLDDVDAFIKNENLDLETQVLLKESSDKIAGRMYSSERAGEMLRKLEKNRKKADFIRKGEGKYARLSPEQRAQRAENVMNADFQQFANSLVTSALMTFKGKMPIRNVSQVFTVLAPMADPEYVTAGMKSVGSKEAYQKAYEEYMAKGILKPRDVRSAYGPWYQKGINHLNSYGMAQFYNSDDFTRIVAARTASERFSDGIELWKQGKMPTEKFAKFMKIDYLGEVDQARFMNFLSQRKFEQAETMIQRRWADMTMFDYDLLNKPEGLTHGIGKAFGQYSTYPLSYMQFMKRGWKADKLQFAAKATVASAIIGAFYNDVLNIGGLPMLPTDTMLFTGGPLITTGASMMTTLGGYADPATKAKMVAQEAVRLGVPMYGIGHSLIKGMEEFKEAEYLDGLSRVLGATPADESYLEKVSDLF